MKAQMQKNKSPRLSCLMVCLYLMISLNGYTQSIPLPTDRGRLKIVKIEDIRGGDSLMVVRTDAGTPLRGASPWIEKRQTQLSSIDWIKFTLMRPHEITPKTLTQAMEGDEWKLVWSDEFDGKSVDTTKWTYDIGNWGWG